MIKKLKRAVLAAHQHGVSVAAARTRLSTAEAAAEQYEAIWVADRAVSAKAEAAAFDAARNAYLEVDQCTQALESAQIDAQFARKKVRRLLEKMLVYYPK